MPAIASSAYPRPEQGGDPTYLQVVVGYMVARVLISVLFIPRIMLPGETPALCAPP